MINNRLRCFAHGACYRVDTGDIEDHPGHGHLPSKFVERRNMQRFSDCNWIEYNVEVVDDQVVLVARKQELEKLERTNIADDMEIEAKPVVAIIGAGAGNTTDDQR